MTININNKQKAIEQALFEKRIKDALFLLGELSKELKGGMLIDEHYNLELTYKNLLKYTIEGVEDPHRSSVYQNIILSCYSLSDKIFTSIKNTQSSTFFYETRRILNQTKETNIESLGNNFYSELTKNSMTQAANISSQQSHLATTQLFNTIWVGGEISDTDENYLKKLLNDTALHYSYRCLFITALTLGALHEFSLWKTLLLFDCIAHEENTIKQRAITGLLLVLFKHDNRINLYPRIISRLNLLKDNDKLLNNILTTTIQLIRTRETEKISRKLSDEILPEVVKMQPNLRNKLDLENMISDKFLEGENPEWEDFFKDSPELMSKLEELTELQMEGSDVFLSTFKMLKHFSFFNTLHNWFIPFYIENKDIKDALDSNSEIFSSKAIQDSLANSGFLCNSDKYSLFLSIPHMPQFQKEMMGNMLKQQLEQMEEIENSERMISPEKMESVISNRYIQDLYRFFKLHPQHAEFEDIFSWNMDFHNKWFYKDIISNTVRLRQIAEFLFKKEYFIEASEAFEIIALQEPNNVELTQKTAYCQQQIKNYTAALNLYLKADILKPEQAWTTKKIALMYKYLKQPEKALEYYAIAERLKPNDLHTQASIGHCYLDLKKHKEALKYYFKVEYMDESNTKVWRPIAWCSFVAGNLDQAEKYYHKLLVSSTSQHDLVNIGHVSWCQNNKIEALKFYQKAIQLMNNNFSTFLNTFNEDLVYLIQNGIKKEDVPIILDQLKYALNL
jgi:tetratricopeptide (TPR) repeat protein